MKTRIITAVVGIIVLIGVLFTFDTLIFNLVIAAITEFNKRSRRFGGI